MEITRQEVDKAQVEAQESWTKMNVLEVAYEIAAKDYVHKLNRFKDLDYKLALTDGRYKIVPPAGERKEKKQPQLTLEQLKEIAAKLGFNLNETTVEESLDEETIEDLIKEEEIIDGNSQ